MIRGLYTVASGIITSEKSQSSVMNNIANAITPGYKSKILSLKSFDEVYISNKDGANNKKQTIGSMSNGVEINDRTTNFSQGNISNTGVKTDFAIQGEGFFVVNFPKDNSGNYQNIDKVGFNFYEGQNPIFVNNPHVVSSSLEKSNVNVAEETSNMMAIMRNFESNTTVLKTLDSTLDKAVNEIGSVR